MMRSNFVKGLDTSDFHKWFWEAQDKNLKPVSTYFDKIANVIPMSSIKGGYYQSTTAIGSAELKERVENEPIQYDDPSEGFTVYGKIRSFDLGVRVPRELQRDMYKVKDFCKSYIMDNMPQAVAVTKEKALAAILNKGGFTSGDAVFNQDIPGVLTTGNGDMPYDDKPLFSLTGNNHTAKNGSTYFNANANTYSFDNVITAYKLLTSTNAFRENGTPFDNTQDLVLICNPKYKINAMADVSSTLVPNNNNNQKNPLLNAYDVIANPFLTANSQEAWILARKGWGITMAVAEEPTFEFWRDYEKKTYSASASIDIMVCVENWRGLVGCDFPTS